MVAQSFCFFKASTLPVRKLGFHSHPQLNKWIAEIIPNMNLIPKNIMRGYLELAQYM